MSEESNFRRHNGLLRFWAIVLGCVALGLTLSKFRPAEINELIFVSSLGFCTVVSIIHFGLCFLNGCVQDGKCFKVSDFMFHITSGILLSISSVLMLLVAAAKGKVMDYRFQDTKVVLIRTIAGILGLQAAFIYFCLAYLTITDKQFVYCRRNPKRKKEEVETGTNVAADTSPARDPENPGATLLSPCRVFLGRLTLRRMVADEVLQARMLTVALGATSVGLTADSYQPGNEIEEFFFSMTIVCLSLTVLSHVVYLAGCIRLAESVITILDVILHYFSSLSLLLGGTLMLGSVVQSSSYSYQDESIERTVAAVVGIYNGLSYGFIGTRLKRLYFRQLYGKEAFSVLSADLAKDTQSNGGSQSGARSNGREAKEGCVIS